MRARSEFPSRYAKVPVRARAIHVQPRPVIPKLSAMIVLANAALAVELPGYTHRCRRVFNPGPDRRRFDLRLANDRSPPNSRSEGVGGSVGRSTYERARAREKRRVDGVDGGRQPGDGRARPKGKQHLRRYILSTYGPNDV